jgi:hypothetical protein
LLVCILGVVVFLRCFCWVFFFFFILKSVVVFLVGVLVSVLSAIDSGCKDCVVGGAGVAWCGFLLWCLSLLTMENLYL